MFELSNDGSRIINNSNNYRRIFYTLRSLLTNNSKVDILKELESKTPWVLDTVCTDSEFYFAQEEFGDIAREDLDLLKKIAYAMHPAVPQASFVWNVFDDYFYTAYPMYMKYLMEANNLKEFCKNYLGSGRVDLVKIVASLRHGELLDWAHIFSSSASTDDLIEFLSSSDHAFPNLSEHSTETVESWRDAMSLIGAGNARRLMLNGASVEELDALSVLLPAGVKVLSGIKIRNGSELMKAITNKVPKEFTANEVKYPDPPQLKELSRLGVVINNYKHQKEIGARLKLCCGNAEFLRKCSTGRAVLLLVDNDYLMEINLLNKSISQFRGYDNKNADKPDIVAKVEAILRGDDD